MIKVTRMPTRICIKEIIILRNSSYNALQDNINKEIGKYLDINNSTFVSDIKFMIPKGQYYFATITISDEELDYDMSED